MTSKERSIACWLTTKKTSKRRITGVWDGSHANYLNVNDPSSGFTDVTSQMANDAERFYMARRHHNFDKISIIGCDEIVKMLTSSPANDANFAKIDDENISTSAPQAVQQKLFAAWSYICINHLAESIKLHCITNSTYRCRLFRIWNKAVESMRYIWIYKS